MPAYAVPWPIFPKEKKKFDQPAEARYDRTMNAAILEIIDTALDLAEASGPGLALIRFFAPTLRYHGTRVLAHMTALAAFVVRPR